MASMPRLFGNLQNLGHRSKMISKTTQPQKKKRKKRHNNKKQWAKKEHHLPYKELMDLWQPRYRCLQRFQQKNKWQAGIHWRACFWRTCLTLSYLFTQLIIASIKSFLPLKKTDESPNVPEKSLFNGNWVVFNAIHFFNWPLSTFSNGASLLLLFVVVRISVTF